MARKYVRPAVRLALAAAIGSLGSLVSPHPIHSQDLVGEATDGKVIYDLHCMRCHGAGGHGDGPQAPGLMIPPADFHAPISRMKSDEQLLTSIEFGVVMSPMHAWRGRLSEQEMQAVVAYVRRLAQRGR